MSRHHIPAEHFELLAQGNGDVGTVELLVAAERSRRLLLLDALLEAATANEMTLGPLGSASSSWDALCVANERFSDVFDEILLLPQVGVWISHALRRVRSTTPGSAPMWVDVGHLHALSFTVHARAGEVFATRLPSLDGCVMLPSLGLVRLRDASTAFGVVDASTDGTMMRFVSRDGHEIEVPIEQRGDTEHWWNLRRLRSEVGGHVLELWLDDIDPFRNFADPVRPERLDDDAVARWQELIDGAWKILVENHPDSARVLSAGMTSLTPLPSSEDWIWTTRSGSTGDAFGGAIIAPPTTPLALAEALVHEFQHMKLGSLLHLVQLCNDDGREHLYAPWRDDPRPVEGMLQGVYAFVGITDFWRRERDKNHDDVRFCNYQFSLWRRQVRVGIESLLQCPSLTEIGRDFVGRLARVVEHWHLESVPRDIEDAARIVANDHRGRWRIRHLRPDPVFVNALVEMWRSREARVMVIPDVEVIPEPEVVPDSGAWSHRRTELHRLRSAAPEMFNDVLTDPNQLDRRFIGATAADLALATGNPITAADSYTTEIIADPKRLDAWIGLGLALSQIGEGSASKALLSMPELVCAVHLDCLRHGDDPRPRELAAWIGDLLVADDA